MKTKKRKQWKYQVVLIIMSLLLLYPTVYMISTSFKNMNEIYNSGLHLLPQHPTMENYVSVFGSLDVIRFLLNSLAIATLAMVMKIVTSVLASYALVFMDFRFKNALFLFFSVTMFIPFSVVMLPNYLTIYNLKLLNSVIGVALPMLADAMGIFRIRQAMRTIPKSLVEAARVDNVGHFTTMMRIVVPLVKPSVVAMSIYFFINAWNEYFWPMMIMKGRENYTITLALQLFTASEAGSAWGSSMALASIATVVPLILYLAAQKQIIGTFMQSGVKE